MNGKAVLWIIGLLAWGLLHFQVRGTTLRSAWWWALGSWLLIGWGEMGDILFQSAEQKTSLPHFRYFAVIGSFAPMMAVLGAKRPQHIPWQFIVFSLVGILWLPGIQPLLFGGGSPPRPHAAWWLFLGFLLLIETLNYLATRYVVSVLCVAGAQMIWLREFFFQSSSRSTSFEIPDFLPVGLGSIALILPLWQGYQNRKQPCYEGAAWREFRHRYGMVWALRLIDRFNSDARQAGLPWQLTWNGLFFLEHEIGIPVSERANPGAEEATSSKNHPEKESLDEKRDTRISAERRLAALLRRFVTPQWLKQFTVSS